MGRAGQGRAGQGREEQGSEREVKGKGRGFDMYAK